MVVGLYKVFIANFTLSSLHVLDFIRMNNQEPHMFQPRPGFHTGFFFGGGGGGGGGEGREGGIPGLPPSLSRYIDSACAHHSACCGERRSREGLQWSVI